LAAGLLVGRQLSGLAT